MNRFQNIGFFISFIYICYVYWFNYKEENFHNRKRLIINFVICFCWASFGMLMDNTPKNSSFLMPIFQIILILLIDWVFRKTIKRNFYPCSGYGMLPKNSTIFDALITLLSLLINIFLPVILLNLIVNCRAFDN